SLSERLGGTSRPARLPYSPNPALPGVAAAAQPGRTAQGEKVVRQGPVRGGRAGTGYGGAFGSFDSPPAARDSASPGRPWAVPWWLNRASGRRVAGEGQCSFAPTRLLHRAEATDWTGDTLARRLSPVKNIPRTVCRRGVDNRPARFHER